MKIFLLFILSCFLVSDGSFKSAQLKYSRVKESYAQKEAVLKKNYKEMGLNFEKQSIFLRVFKKEKELELWVRNDKSVYKCFRTYTICSASGNLGPKRKMGDYQVPEGFYHIDRFNPASAFYLSLGLNYPNASDKILSDKTNPGGDIFIHGNCVSIGCMAMTDDKIMEIYIAAVEAKSGGQKTIPVHVFPFRMTETNNAEAEKTFREDKDLLMFWNNIKSGFDFFEKNKQLPNVSVDAKGNYLFRK